MDNTVADLDSVPLLRTTSDLPKQPLYVPLSRSELPLRVPMPYQYMPQQEPQISGHDRAVQAVNEDHLGFFSVGMMVALAIRKIAIFRCSLKIAVLNLAVVSMTKCWLYSSESGRWACIGINSTGMIVCFTLMVASLSSMVLAIPFLMASLYIQSCRFNLWCDIFSS